MKIQKKPPIGGGKQSNIHQISSLYSTTHHEDIEGFRQFAAGYGLPIPEIIADGKIHRFQVDGDRRGTKNGWFVLFSYPVAAGAVGSWRSGESFTWCAKSTQQLSHAEREALKRQYQQARLERLRAHELAQQTAATRAQAILAQATPAPLDHPYLVRKRIPPLGLKVYRGRLLAELRDIHGELHSLQFIAPDGEKRFLSGGRTKGVFHAFGSLEDAQQVYLAEGMATALTVHFWKQSPVLAAMNAGNLLPVALAVRQEYPALRIVFAADNDCHNPVGNVGRIKAEEAARVVGGDVLLPEFPRESSGTDWNDFYLEHGGIMP